MMIEEKKIEDALHWAYENNQMRSEKIIHKLIISLLIAMALLFISNALWLWAWVQYDYTSEEITYTQDGRGLNIIGDRNGVQYGAEGDGEEKNP